MTTLAQIQAAGLNLVVPEKGIAEPLAAPTPLTSSNLAILPDSIYNLTQDSHLFRFLISIAGESGASQIKKQMLLPKLAQSLDGTHFHDLDLLYGNTLGLARLPSESYTYNPTGGLLTQAQWVEVKAKDASYRSRCLIWMRAILYGATVRGIALAAQAALGVECDVFERYRYISNLSSDIPVDVFWTNSFEEGGFYDGAKPTIFAWTYSLGGAATEPSMTSNVSHGRAVDGSNYLEATSAGGGTDVVTVYTFDYIQIDINFPYTYTAFWRRATNSGNPKSAMKIFCYTSDGDATGTVYPTTAIGGITTPGSSGAVNPNAGVASTAWVRWGGQIPASSWPADTAKVQLEIVVYGTSSSTGAINVDAVQFEQGDQATLFNLKVPGLTKSPNEAVIIPQLPDVTDQERRAIITLVDRLRPTDCFPTVESGDRIRVDRPAQIIAASSSNFYVQRLVTGRTDLPWPTVDSTQGFWIESGIEHEAPTQAFQDSQDSASFVPILEVAASSESVGYFNGTQQSLFPQLAANVTKPLEVHQASFAVAENYSQLFITGSWLKRNVSQSDKEISPIVDVSYPLDYFSLTP